MFEFLSIIFEPARAVWADAPPSGIRPPYQPFIEFWKRSENEFGRSKIHSFFFVFELKQYTARTRGWYDNMGCFYSELSTFKSIFQLAIEAFIEALIPSESIDALCSKVKNYLTYINFLEVIKI